MLSHRQTPFLRFSAPASSKSFMQMPPWISPYLLKERSVFGFRLMMKASSKISVSAYVMPNSTVPAHTVPLTNVPLHPYPLFPASSTTMKSVELATGSVPSAPHVAFRYSPFMLHGCGIEQLWNSAIFG